MFIVTKGISIQIAILIIIRIGIEIFIKWRKRYVTGNGCHIY